MTFATELEANVFLAQIKAQVEAEGKTTTLVVAPTTHGYWTIVSPHELAEPPKTCSICLQPFHEFSNNAEPVTDGRCCAYCDDHVVVPTRIRIGEEIRLARGEQASEEHGVAIIFEGVTGEAMQRIREEAARRGVSEDDVVNELLTALSAPLPPDEQLVLCNPGEEEVDEERARLNGQILTELAMKHLPPGTLQ